MKCTSSDILWFIFSMLVIRRFESGAGSSGQDRPWLTGGKIRALISYEFVTAVQGQIAEPIGSINIAIMEYIDDVTLHLLRLLLLQRP